MPMFNGKRVIGSYEALNDLPPNKKYFLCSKTGQYFEQFEDFCNHQLFLKTNSFYPFTAQDNVKKQKLTYDQARAIEEQAFDDISAISAGLRNGIFYLIQHCIVRYSVSDALHDIYQFTNNRYFLDEQVLWEDEGAFKQATVVGVNLIPTDILNEMVSPDLVTYDLQVNQQNQVFKISNVTFNNIHRDSTVIKASYVRNLVCEKLNAYFINPVLYEVHQFSTQKISEKTLIGLRQLLRTTPNHLYYIKDASEWRQFVGSLKKNTHREGNLLKNLKYLGKYIENVLAQGSEFMDFLSTLSPEDEWSKDYYGDSWTVVAKEALLSIVKDILEYSSVRYLSNIRKWKDQFDGNTVDLNNYLVDNVSATDESVLLMLIPFMLVLDEKEKEIKGEELIHRNDTDITLEEIQAMKMQAKTLTKNHELLNIMNLFKNTVDWNRRIIFLKCEICNYQYAKNMELIRCQSCRKTYHYNCIPFKCYDEYRYCSSCYSLDSALELMPLEHQKGLQDYVIDVEDSNQLISPLPLSSENILEIKSILGTLSKNPVAHHFIKVINALDYPDYYDYISHVMCIEIIQSNLENDCYSSTQDILRDVKLMTDNALLFNGYNHYVSLCARKIETYLVTKLVNL
uniref:Bromo domain-containing protein n=1 Tax=Rhabditophanes sp. KR3021 TaxID=114890 RepID=A0AC35TJX4_9BILA